jgi:hypothetical protein
MIAFWFKKYLFINVESINDQSIADAGGSNILQ